MAGLSLSWFALGSTEDDPRPVLEATSLAAGLVVSSGCVLLRVRFGRGLLAAMMVMVAVASISLYQLVEDGREADAPPSLPESHERWMARTAGDAMVEAARLLVTSIAVMALVGALLTVVIIAREHQRLRHPKPDL